MPSGQLIIRRALPEEAERIRAMQEFSFRILGCGFYSPEQIDGFVRQVGTLEDALLEEGRYFVATGDEEEIVGSGGWSMLEPRYAATLEEDARSGEATVRAVYVAPSAARRGIGSAIMHRIETDAAESGVDRLRLMATLSGVRFYERLGYSQGRRRDMALSAGLSLSCVEMERRLQLKAAAA